MMGKSSPRLFFSYSSEKNPVTNLLREAAHHVQVRIDQLLRQSLTNLSHFLLISSHCQVMKTRPTANIEL